MKIKNSAYASAFGGASADKQNSNLKVLVVIFIIGAMAFVAGCAKTVTPLPVVGNQISLEMTLRGNIDTANNKYYLILSSSSPLVPYKDIYFFAPGENYDLNKMNVYTDLNSYYTNYFTAWSDFIDLKGSIFTVTNGPFVAALHTSYTPQYLAAGASGAATNKITLTFNLSRLSSIPQTLYFNFVTVDKDGYERDYLKATDNKISTVTGTQILGRVESMDPTVDASLDITGWSMVVQ